jgi:hypothetical protein
MNEDAAGDYELKERLQLRTLTVKAPENTFPRFRRRVGLMQGGKLLLASQVTGFWLVLDTLLKRFFRAVPLQHGDVPQDSKGEKA